MVLPAISQTTSKGIIKSVVNEKGDTLIVMSLSDAKLILTDLLEYEITDSLLNVYIERDSLNQKKITIKDELIVKLGLQNDNKDIIIHNLEEVVKNTKEIVSLKDSIIEKLNLQNKNKDEIIKNLNDIVTNKIKEIDYKDLTIEEQQKEINKQRNLKRLGFVGSVVLPIITLILLL